MARIIAYLIQKVARRLRKTVVVATTHRDLVEDFQPDIVVEKGFENDVKVVSKEIAPKKCSIFRGIKIEKGSIEDYSKLSRFHYRTKGKDESAGLRLKDCYRLLFNGKLIGVIVYSRSYLNLKARNMVFGERYVYTPGDLHRARLINEEIARISRVVIHPKFRGIGLGAFLVRETLPLVKAKVVEVLAAMAKYNPFFEKAGMIQVAYRRDEVSVEKKIRRFLEAHGFDLSFVKSKTYCGDFFSQLDAQDNKALVGYLSEYARQPFVKVKAVKPELLARVCSSSGVYLYWANDSLCRPSHSITDVPARLSGILSPR